MHDARSLIPDAGEKPGDALESGENKVVNLPFTVHSLLFDAGNKTHGVSPVITEL
jgi:hypothetical protein